ncbi:hypothetical protein OCOL_000394 [Ordospora colligata]|uniref:Uncharacterized protein n=1 Tax=Ordospora colligata OC4 TaxID=1354746 RepID=A0A0B2UIG7_9MICR|nr:uncharacterized protein M896_100230 [Ordospora colligata OC4]KHN69039.1 hypothetical protein M896_100230 [Ordospora colligata OC4]TBU14320.1 hypothetical protein CWI40_100240 [Ordospora colligata]TBU14385.1 hypothetical protein CWI41_100240 [Ordospora colligata]
MALTYRERLEFLEELKRGAIDLTAVDRMVGYAEDRLLTKPVLLSLVKELTRLDAYISVMHGILEQDEWDEVLSEYDTPIEGEHAKLREAVRVFLFAYERLERVVYEFETEEILDAFRKPLASKTLNVQFLLFRVCSVKPLSVFKFLFELVDENPTVFIPYLSSLAVRCKFDEEIKKCIVDEYVNYVRGLKRNASIHVVVACQCLLYMSCFMKRIVCEARDEITWMFSSGLVGCMNKNVVKMFCEIYGYECKVFRSYDYDCLYFFPFDMPVLNEVYESVDELYIHFER